MDSLLLPDIVSGQLQVTEIEDAPTSPDGAMQANALLSAPVSPDFKDHWNDTDLRPMHVRVPYASAGVDIRPDFSAAEFQSWAKATRGRLTIPATITRVPEGLPLEKLSDLAPLDALMGHIVLLDDGQKISDDDRTKIIQAIHQQFPGVAEVLDPENSTFDLGKFEYLIEILSSGIDVQDLQRFVADLRSPAALSAIASRTKVDRVLREPIGAGDSRLVEIAGFTHPDVIALFEDMPGDADLVGARVVFPRRNKKIYEASFLTRVRALRELCLDELKVPVKMFNLARSTRIATGGRHDVQDSFEEAVEPFAKLDLEILPSYSATEIVFDLMRSVSGGRKATILRDQADWKRLLDGDISLVKACKKVNKKVAAGLIALAENPSLPISSTVQDPESFAEVRLLDGMQPGEDGILFCKYFPADDIFRRLPDHADKLRALVFQAPSYEKAESVIQAGEENYPLEAHIFLSAEQLVALRRFHRQFPHIKIVWSHPGAKRNLVFVDDGHLPMFAKPEIVEDLKDEDSNIRVSFCGSSTVKKGAPQSELDAAAAEEKAFTAMYNEYASGRDQKLVGINGGGPDVMDRNGRDLQELGAISVASSCDLGFAGQTRHDSWDAVLNSGAGTDSFALREEILLSGDIVHVAPGGIGSIQEVIGILAQNKIGAADKTLILVGREYWGPQVNALVAAGEADNLKPQHLRRLFVVDTPEEARAILEKTDSDPSFLDQRTQIWEAHIKGQEGAIDPLAS
jgi:predicted Rossmann-fold nucleotide-binding protein